VIPTYGKKRIVPNTDFVTFVMPEKLFAGLNNEAKRYVDDVKPKEPCKNKKGIIVVTGSELSMD